MFQQKLEKIFGDLSKIFDITDSILIVGYYEHGRDHDTMQR